MTSNSSFSNTIPPNLSRWLVVVPARLKSERLPNKPLADLGGKALIVRVYENLKPLRELGANVIVAVDHESTASACANAGVPWIMTSENHPSGTDRCCEVAQANSSYPMILNVQGDEPFVNCQDLITLMAAMDSQKHPMGTLGITVHDWNEYQNPNTAKIALAEDNTAIYFSRAPIPFDREADRNKTHQCNFTKHIGVYAFRRESLLQFCEYPPSQLEQIEKLEQLRAVSHGWKIFVAQATSHSIGIDTPEDLESARRKIRG